MITPAQAELFNRLMLDGATVRQATAVVQLATAIDAIELGWLGAWEHELRAPNGKWISPGAVSESGEVKIVPKDVRVTPTLHKPTPKAPKPTGLLPPSKRKTPITSQKDLDAAMAEMEDRVSQALVDMTASTTRKLREQNASSIRLSELKQRAEEQARFHLKTKHKAYVEVGISVGALILAIVEGMIGAPGLTQVLSAMAPPVVQAIAEWRKRL